MKNKIKKNIVGLLSLVLMMVQSYTPVFATATAGAGDASATATNDIVNKVLPPIMILKTILIAGAGAVGVVIAIKGIVDLGTAIPQQDSSGISMATRELIGGGIIIAVDVIIGIFTL